MQVTTAYTAYKTDKETTLLLLLPLLPLLLMFMRVRLMSNVRMTIHYLTQRRPIYSAFG